VIHFLSKGEDEELKKVLKSKNIGEKITYSIYKLNSEIAKINRFLAKLEDREKRLYDEIVKSKLRGDERRAAMYANELAELRKIIGTLTVSKLALEKVLLRLETILHAQNAATIVAQLEPIVLELSKSMKNIMPEVSLELENVHCTLSDLAQSLPIEGLNFTVEAPYVSAEARTILEEAKKVARRKLKEKFPKP